ncbi:MAG TPA: SDR family oxidoreductase [Jatrophihabitantaceae bacterium]|jgi:NAD(P)-dependent dehydrogenase (short-subunit alcohol dehydrogenase family)
MPLALITGASKGLGRALAHGLAERGWSLVLDARGAPALEAVARELPGGVTAIAGDVTDPSHRSALSDAVRGHGRLDLLVNNASYLGPSPMPALADFPLAELARVYEVDVLAPLALLQHVLPLLAVDAAVLNISSDAAVEAYAGWGGYGSAKAALDQLTAVLAVELPGRSVYAVDPGDMRTEMHQAAFPGEDISDRVEPSAVVPALLRLLDQRPASGRYRASEFAIEAVR